MIDATTFSFTRAPDDVVHVRSLLRSGEPWFVAADAARALGLSMTSGGVTKHLARLSADEVFLARKSDPNCAGLFGGVHAPSFKLISEAGLYKLIMRSDKAEALAFRHWIASEVLPSIRKTGKYALADHGREAMPLPMDIAEAALFQPA